MSKRIKKNENNVNNNENATSVNISNSNLIDVTKGSLLSCIISLAIPSVIQSILSNCYAFNDFLFVGLMTKSIQIYNNHSLILTL